MTGAPQAPDGPEREDGQDPAARELIPRTPGEPGWMRLIGPIRSENAAFSAVLWVAGAAIAVAVVAVIVRAIT